MDVLLRVVVAMCLLGPAGHAAAQSAERWPTKPIRLVVPFAPGGSSEIIARSLAARLSTSLGQQVFVENKPGAAGNVAMEDVKRAPHDGYTLILGHVGTLAVNPALFGTALPYDPMKDFLPVSMVATVPNVIAVNPEVPARTLAEFVNLAKAKPGKLNYGTAGNGSAGHLAMEYFKMEAKLDIVHIPYKGTGPMLTDLLGGRTEATFNGVPPIAGQIKSGKLRPLAVGSARRIATLPDVPTIAESGYPGFETSQWYGILVPAGTPSAIVERLQREIAAATRDAPAMQRVTEDGGVLIGNTPSEFAALIASEQKKWGAVIKAANVKPD